MCLSKTTPSLASSSTAVICGRPHILLLLLPIIPQQYPRPSWEIAPEDIAIDRDALKLGSGAFGTVYRAKWRGGLVAAKVMRGMLGPLVRQAFEEEIVLMEQMRHPNVIQVGLPPGGVYLNKGGI